jgi:hypothetical protein
MDQLDEYRHMWDGTEPGWTLTRVDRLTWRVVFAFDPSGPTKAEVIRLRKLLKESQDVPTAEVWNCLRGATSYQAQEEFGNLDAKRLHGQATKAGLRATFTSRDEGGYLPISPLGMATIIEDDDMARQVIARMMEAGVSVKNITHVD